MKIHIDKHKCVGCGICRFTAPALFYINGYHAETFSDSESLIKEDELLSCRLLEVINTCPAEAITIEYEPDEQHLRQDNGCSAQILPFDQLKAESDS
jgi:ferredoxin